MATIGQFMRSDLSFVVEDGSIQEADRQMPTIADRFFIGEKDLRIFRNCDRTPCRASDGRTNGGEATPESEGVDVQFSRSLR